MKTKWLKQVGAALAVGAIAVLAFGAVAFAQQPTPTAPDTAPKTNPGNPPFFGGPRGGFHGGPGGGPEFGMLRGENSLLAVAAQALGTTDADLIAQLRAGKSLSELAAAKSVSTTTIVSDYLKPIQEALTTGVTDKALTQAQADAMLALQKANAEAALDYKHDPNAQQGPRLGRFGGFGGFFFGWGFFGRGPGQPPAPNQQQPAPQTTPQQSN